MNLLKDLYSGKIYPFEKIVPTDKAYRVTSEKAGELREYLQEKSSPEDKEKFRQCEQYTHEVHCMECFANFSYGFRLGVMLLLDVFSGIEPTE